MKVWFAKNVMNKAYNRQENALFVKKMQTLKTLIEKLENKYINWIFTAKIKKKDVMNN